MISFQCDNCGTLAHDRDTEFARKKRHFCSRVCYSQFRRDKLPLEEQHAYQGGVTPEESRRRWAAKNKRVLALRQQARRQREIDAPGSHTKAEWEAVKKSYGNQCADHDATCRGGITKDHKVPLAFGGSQDPDNLQPLCRSHNSRKSTRVYLETFKEEKSNELRQPVEQK